ncbi:hypothetical protein Bsel_0198 [[Bacillus] selenitireducens MLS10]|uniref:Uncharacterized protein n=1 Tax=Bacillus selenitireducens (strain ATCC 700615 / DSM 15326 / MLS10) TaxID=439292 RepID=D6XVX2_BACIE|nr:hypothetical protein Bsel_0198 [[Bacillus] selenitireducens MLS10]
MFWSDLVAVLIGSFINALIITRLVRFMLKKWMGDGVRVATYTFSISFVFYMVFNYIIISDIVIVIRYILFALLLYGYDLFKERDLRIIGGVDNQIKQ